MKGASVYISQAELVALEAAASQFDYITESGPDDFEYWEEVSVLLNRVVKKCHRTLPYLEREYGKLLSEQGNKTQN